MRLTLVVDFYLLDVTDAFLMFRPVVCAVHHSSPRTPIHHEPSCSSRYSSVEGTGSFYKAIIFSFTSHRLDIVEEFTANKTVSSLQELTEGFTSPFRNTPTSTVSCR